MKRARTAIVTSPGKRRPIDKKLISVIQAVTTSQDSTTLLTVGTPGTVVGLRWSLVYLGTNAEINAMSWAIVIVRDGQTVSTLNLSDGSTLYAPEQDVIAFGSAVVDQNDGIGPLQRVFDGASKGMRKLREGDTLRLISLGSVAGAGTFNGAVQLFVKS